MCIELNRNGGRNRDRERKKEREREKERRAIGSHCFHNICTSKFKRIQNRIAFGSFSFCLAVAFHSIGMNVYTCINITSDRDRNIQYALATSFRVSTFLFSSIISLAFLQHVFISVDSFGPWAVPQLWYLKQFSNPTTIFSFSFIRCLINRSTLQKSNSNSIPEESHEGRPYKSNQNLFRLKTLSSRKSRSTCHYFCSRLHVKMTFGSGYDNKGYDGDNPVKVQPIFNQFSQNGRE